MTTCFSSPPTVVKDAEPATQQPLKRPTEVGAALLTGGFDRPYAFGLAMALASKGICLDVIGSDEVDSPELHTTPQLKFLNLEGSKRSTGLAAKISRVLTYYARLLSYAATAKPEIFHILWNNKFQFFDRTLLMLYYKAWGKKIALTVHNVNAGKRDRNDSLFNRLTLRTQYLLADHLFVHTEKMKTELCQDYGVRARAISVIPFGINNSVPDTDLTSAEAKQRLGIRNDEKTILFFGAIRPYKGLEYLTDAFRQLSARNVDYRLIIAGEPKKGCEKYIGDIQQGISNDPSRERVIQEIRHIPDEETELYFKAADVVVLPYTQVFQSGVLFLAYSFGLPVIATDVGSIKEDVIEGETGFLCKPCDAVELARAIGTYFESDLFKTLGRRRQEIRDYAGARHSWDTVGAVTRNVYVELAAR
ncbi:MAG TPA: glycosyltransferase [Terriglobales bacterium]|jgi:glycosyltransferase involved in cell wall biosynthesis|nr:glycosyltransferase [Terriglobales bacterium]